jgi:hypothetical protein
MVWLFSDKVDDQHDHGDDHHDQERLPDEEFSLLELHVVRIGTWDQPQNKNSP